MNTRALRDPVGTTHWGRDNEPHRAVPRAETAAAVRARAPLPLIGILLLLAGGAAAPARATTSIINSPITGPLTVNAGDRVEIHTGGSVASATTGVIVNAGGELIIFDGSVFGGNGPGEISVFVNGGTLTISGGTVSGDYGVVVNSGTTTLSGGSVSGGLAGVMVNGGTATLSGGSVSGNPGVEVIGGKAIISGGTVGGGTIGVGVSGGTAIMPGCNLLRAGTTLLGILQDGTPINMPVSVSPPGQLILDSDATQITCPVNQTVPATPRSPSPAGDRSRSPACPPPAPPSRSAPRRSPVPSPTSSAIAARAASPSPCCPRRISPCSSAPPAPRAVAIR